MASPLSCSWYWCTTPASSCTSRRASIASGWTTIPLKSSYQCRPSLSTGKQAWAAMASAISSVICRPWAPLNCLLPKNCALSRRSCCRSAASRSAKKGWRASVASQSACGITGLVAATPKRVVKRCHQPARVECSARAWVPDGLSVLLRIRHRFNHQICQARCHCWCSRTMLQRFRRKIAGRPPWLSCANDVPAAPGLPAHRHWPGG